MKKQDQDNILTLIEARRLNTADILCHFQQKRKRSSGDPVKLAHLDGKLERLENEIANLRFLSAQVESMRVEPEPDDALVAWGWILPMLVDMAVAQRRDDPGEFLAALGILDLYLGDLRRMAEVRLKKEGGAK